jgi:hypothetical protein
VLPVQAWRRNAQPAPPGAWLCMTRAFFTNFVEKIVSNGLDQDQSY